MSTNLENHFRKFARDFKGRIELMKRTELHKLESLFLELYELGLRDYLEIEKKKNPNRTHKEIIVSMYQFHDKIRGR